MPINVEKDKILPMKGEFWVTNEMMPTRQHQIYDELLQMEKEFGALIRFKRDQERDVR